LHHEREKEPHFQFHTQRHQEPVLGLQVTKDVSVGVRDFLDGLFNGVPTKAVGNEETVSQAPIAEWMGSFGVQLPDVGD